MSTYSSITSFDAIDQRDELGGGSDSNVYETFFHPNNMDEDGNKPSRLDKSIDLGYIALPLEENNLNKGLLNERYRMQTTIFTQYYGLPYYSLPYAPNLVASDELKEDENCYFMKTTKGRIIGTSYRPPDSSKFSQECLKEDKLAERLHLSPTDRNWNEGKFYRYIYIYNKNTFINPKSNQNFNRS
jgi:hypothetical protein